MIRTWHERLLSEPFPLDGDKPAGLPVCTVEPPTAEPQVWRVNVGMGVAYLSERQVRRAPQLRQDMTEGERRVWQLLRERKIEGFKFRRQVPLGPYIADFTCMEARLIVEIDGGQHGDERDARRDRWLSEQGFRVMRFWNNDVASNIEGVYQQISGASQAMGKDKDRESPWARARVHSVGHPHPNPSPVEGEGLKRAPSTYSSGGAKTRERTRPTPSPLAGEGWDGGRAPAAPAREARLYGLNACLAAFAKRPESLRKVYLTEARIPVLKNVLAWCVKHRLGYRVVEEADLDKLTSSRHHEGVCFDMTRTPPLDLASLLANLPKAPSPSLLLWLDGVGNPHNLGALLRSAAHFGVGGVIVPAVSGLDVSGAAARVAEGAAEVVPFVQASSAVDALAALRAQGYAFAATVPRDGVSLYATKLPPRVVLVFGAEGEGMSDAMIDAAELRLTIPGSGAIESLNVAASVAVLLGEYWRQRAAVS
jgi:TrmH RNA methyltransferase